MNESAVLFGTYSVRLMYVENKGSEMNSDNLIRFEVPSITKSRHSFKMKLQEILFVRGSTHSTNFEHFKDLKTSF